MQHHDAPRQAKAVGRKERGGGEGSSFPEMSSSSEAKSTHASRLTHSSRHDVFCIPFDNLFPLHTHFSLDSLHSAILL